MRYLWPTLYLFAEKFSYIVLNKAAYEKVVEMSTKRRQCRNNPDVFYYICDKYMMTKYRFNVRDFARAYEAYFGMKLREPRQVLGIPQDVQIPYRNGALVDPRQSQFNGV